MLTKEDIDQLKTAMHAEVVAEREETRKIVQEEAGRMIKNELATALKPINRKLNRLTKDISYIVKMYDDDIADHRKRINRIEEHLNLPPLPHSS